MANASSHARAVYKHNTAVLYYEQSETLEDAPVSTARVVSVGGANAARGGGALQLVGEMIESESRERFVGAQAARVSAQPQVVTVEPPRTAPRPRTARPTRVIAYNVRIVAQENGAADGEAVHDTDYMMPDHVRAAMQRQAGVTQRGMPPRARLHPELQLDVPADMHPETAPRQHNGKAQFVMPGRATSWPQPAQFERSMREKPFEMPAGVGPAARMPRRPMPHAGRAASIPTGLFGALEDIGGALHEHARRAASRAQASVADGSYKQLLREQLHSEHGSLLSNRNLCIAVSAYAFVLFLLASFTG